MKVGEELEFFCMLILDKFSERIDYVERWVESTDRLYGLAEGRHVKFPRKPELDLVLPPEPTVVLPPWLE